MDIERLLCFLAGLASVGCCLQRRSVGLVNWGQGLNSRDRLALRDPKRAFREPCMRPRGPLSRDSHAHQGNRSIVQCSNHGNAGLPATCRLPQIGVFFCIGRFCSQVSRSSKGFRSISPWQCQMRCRRRRTFPACLRDAGPNSWDL